MCAFIPVPLSLTQVLLLPNPWRQQEMLKTIISSRKTDFASVLVCVNPLTFCIMTCFLSSLHSVEFDLKNGPILAQKFRKLEVDFYLKNTNHVIALYCIWVHIESKNHQKWMKKRPIFERFLDTVRNLYMYNVYQCIVMCLVLCFIVSNTAILCYF